MLNTLPQRFFHNGDCPCGSPPPYYRSACTSGAPISDERYRTLAETNELQVLGVPDGSNTLAFLKGAVGATGFITYAGGKCKINNAPQLTLPLLNPAVSGSYPQPGGFKYLPAGVGDPADWKHIAAPTAGTWVLQVKNGQWVLVDAGSIPGIQAIGDSSGTAPKGGVLTIVETTPGSGVWTVKRMLVQHARVLVGDIDGDGVQGYKPLPTSAALVHPIGKFQDCRLGTLTTLDSAGNEIAGGLEQAVVVSGAGAVTDGLRMIYSPATKRIYRAPAQTIAFTPVTTSSASTVPPVSYASLPGGHGAGTSRQYNYPTVLINFVMFSNADEIYTIGLFKDGSLLQEFPNRAAQDSFSFTFVDTANSLGGHTYDVRWKKVGSGSGAVVINYSALLIITQG